MCFLMWLLLLEVASGVQVLCSQTVRIRKNCLLKALERETRPGWRRRKGGEGDVEWKGIAVLSHLTSISPTAFVYPSFTFPPFYTPLLFPVLILIHFSSFLSYSSSRFFRISVSSLSPLLQRPYLSLLLIFTIYFLYLTIPFHILDAFSFWFYPVPSFHSVLPFASFGCLAGWGMF